MGQLAGRLAGQLADRLAGRLAGDFSTAWPVAKKELRLGTKTLC